MIADNKILNFQGNETEEAKTDIQDGQDGDLLSILIFSSIVVALLALVTLLVILCLRQRKLPRSSLLVLAEEGDEELAESLCAELRHLLPQMTVISCWDSARPGHLKVSLRTFLCLVNLSPE